MLAAPLFFKKEKITVSKLAGCILGFIGIVIINLDGSSLRFSVGDLFILLASVSAAAGYVISKFLNGKCFPDLLTGWQQLLGGIVLLVSGLVSGGHLGQVTPIGMFYLLLLSFASACSYTLWVKLLQSNDVSSVSVFKFMTPIFGVVSSGLLLGENILNLRNLLSLLLVCVGICTVNMRRKDR